MKLSLVKSDIQKDCDRLLRGIEHIAETLRKYYQTQQHKVENRLNPDVISLAIGATKSLEIYERTYRAGYDLSQYKLLYVSFVDYLGYVRTGEIRAAQKRR